MKLKMIDCPKCGNEFPEKRKELGYHVCVNCSTVEPVVGITTVEGTGDHTFNDIIIMEQSRARAIALKESQLTGKKVNLELLDLDKDESETIQTVKEKVSRISDKDIKDEDEYEDEDNEEIEEIEGIDY